MYVHMELYDGKEEVKISIENNGKVNDEVELN